MRVKVAVDYRDGRPARTDVVDVHGVPAGQLLNQGALLQLFDWFFHELGPNELGRNYSGIMLAGDPTLVRYNTPTGIGTVSLARPEDGDVTRTLRSPQEVITDGDSPSAQAAQKLLQYVMKLADPTGSPS